MALTRSEMMQRVKSKDTSPEKSLRSALHRAGLRFRLHRKAEKASIDICFPKAKVAVFVDGCFWHCCPEHFRMPKTNLGYWGPKLARNVERDGEQTKRLVEAGWTVIRVWEHECHNGDLGYTVFCIERMVKACLI